MIFKELQLSAIHSILCGNMHFNDSYQRHVCILHDHWVIAEENILRKWRGSWMMSPHSCANIAAQTLFLPCWISFINHETGKMKSLQSYVSCSVHKGFFLSWEQGKYRCSVKLLFTFAHMSFCLTAAGHIICRFLYMSSESIKALNKLCTKHRNWCCTSGT